MKYIRQYESYNEDIEYILDDYYHDGKLDIIKSEYYKIYQVKEEIFYYDIINAFKRHDINYKSSILINKIGYFYHIIVDIDKKIIEFLDEKFKGLVPKVSNYNKKFIRYYYNGDIPSKNYYNSNLEFYICYETIWLPFSNKFKIENYWTIKIILTWYIINNLHNNCVEVLSNN